MIWALGMTANMKRLDLIREPAGTHVRAWATEGSCDGLCGAMTMNLSELSDYELIRWWRAQESAGEGTSVFAGRACRRDRAPWAGPMKGHKLVAMAE